MAHAMAPVITDFTGDEPQDHASPERQLMAPDQKIFRDCLTDGPGQKSGGHTEKSGRHQAIKYEVKEIVHNPFTQDPLWMSRKQFFQGNEDRRHDQQPHGKPKD